MAQVRFAQWLSRILAPGRGDAEMIRYFKEMDTLPAEDKTALLRVMSGFIRDVKTKQAYAS